MIIISDQDTNICLSGGADGADVQWGMCAGLLGHKVIHWSFSGHKSKAPESELVRLTDTQLLEADPAIKIAAPSLKKHPPNKTWVKNLIQRNYFQVAWTDRVYAVATIKDNLCQGGTAWAVQMYLDRKDVKHEVYIFDQLTDKWNTWDGSKYVVIDNPPQPYGVWTGIGTRDLTQSGKNAIRNLMNYVKPTL